VSEHLDEAAPVRTGDDLDWPRIESYLREHLEGAEGEFTVLQFPHGAANLTYLLRFGDREFVLRRPPFGVIAPGAHDMRREFRVLSRLWRVFDLAPRAYVFCDDHDVAGADFFVMQRRDGVVIRGVLPPSMAGLPDVGRRIGFAVVEAMAALHLVDPAAADLADLGRPEGFVARQVSGWKKRWDLVADEANTPVMTEVHERLERTMPRPSRASLVHNDLKLDNCQFDPADPDRVVSIFDWDMTTVGDPLVDLGTLLNYWPDPADPPQAARGAHPGERQMGLPSRAEIVQRYAERTGTPVESIGWYEAFAQWKTAVVVQQLYNRFARGETQDTRMAHQADRVPALAAGALELIEGIPAG
jgi:aminoglycoside phosphotransferase (APT) family kinase protein